MYYDFHQNASGGTFDVNIERGISVIVIIEADNMDEAINRAEYIGLYFDGYGDCPCCGSRWTEPWDGDNEPCVYGKPVKECVNHTKRTDQGVPDIFVHPKEGKFWGWETKIVPYE